MNALGAPPPPSADRHVVGPAPPHPGPPAAPPVVTLQRFLSRQRAACRGLVERLPMVAILVLAVRNYIGHKSGNLAGSVAFSTVLSMFPLLVVVSASAAFIGQPGDALSMVERILGYAPPLVADTLRPSIEQVLSQPSRILLTVGALVTVWTASSAIQCVRTALNNAYGVSSGLSFWKARIKVTAFTIVAALGALVAFSSVLLLPLIWRLVQDNVADPATAAWLSHGVRYGAAYVVIAVVYAAMYAWLPDLHQRLRTVLPGALVGALLWIVAAAVLSYTLRSAGKLALLYGGLAGLVATLIFLYAGAFTLLFGAEINGAIRERDAPHKNVTRSDE